MRLNLWWRCRDKEGVHTACISGIIRLIHYAIVGYQTQFRYNTDTVASPSISSSKSYKSCLSSVSVLVTSSLISPFSRFWSFHSRCLGYVLNFLLPQPVLLQQRANTESSSKKPPKFFWICYGFFSLSGYFSVVLAVSDEILSSPWWMTRLNINRFVGSL